MGGAEETDETSARARTNHPDWTWSRLIAELPEEERELRFVLPYRIGITWRPDGGWGDYVRFEALYDLVAYVSDAVGDVEQSVLDRYRRAHHCAGYDLLVIDRIADGQVVEDDALAADRVWLREQLVESLGLACGDRALAERTVAVEVERWRVAVEREQAAFASGALDPADYADIVFGKVAPLWIASDLFLRAHGADEELVGRVRRWFELIMLALQLNDDAVDEAEDQGLHRASAPQLLQVEPHAVVRASLHLLERFSLRIAECRRLAEWCKDHHLACRRPGRELAADAIVDELGAQGLLLGFLSLEPATPLGEIERRRRQDEREMI